MKTRSLSRAVSTALLLSPLVLACCASKPEPEPAKTEIPEATRAWMDRLTVKTEYDPKTGFIVAKEVIALPPALADGPTLDEALALGARSDRPVIVFATADRCGPCQQFKKDALNDPRIAQWAARQRESTPGEGPAAVPVHVEVDKNPEAAQRILGSRAIPMTYWLVDGRVVATLRGQRSGDDLWNWLNDPSRGQAPAAR